MTQIATNPMAVSPGDDDQKKQIIASAISEVSHIATLPEVTMKIIQLVDDPNSTAQDLNNVITNDPALGARILKVVNSAFYGLPGQVASINRAIVLLGLNAVKNIAIAASLAKLFRGGDISPHFNARDLWQHSLAVAAGTKLLSQQAGLKLADEAFLAGMMHDIGIMVEIQSRRMQFVEICEKLHLDASLSLREVEEQVLGANHEEFGAAICKAWKFPESFQYVTGYHHHPQDLDDEKFTLAGLVHIADIIAANLQIGFTRTVETTEINEDLLEALNLTSEQVEEVTAALPEAIEEASSLFTE